MSIQLDVSIRNGQLNFIESDTGTSAVVKIRTGSQPANCAAPDSGDVLVEFDLVSDWAGAASGGVKELNGLPVSATASGDGIPGHFRLYKSDGLTCKMQGSVTITDGGGDITIDANPIVSGNPISITAAEFTQGGF